MSSSSLIITIINIALKIVLASFALTPLLFGGKEEFQHLCKIEVVLIDAILDL